MITAETITDEQIDELRDKWVGERVAWSPKYDGCLMWYRGNNAWASQSEGDYPTPQDATGALAFYDAQGVIVDWAEHDARCAEILNARRGAK